MSTPAPVDERDATVVRPARPALPRRLMAMLYDTFLVLPLIMVGVAIASGLGRLLPGALSEEDILAPWAVQLVAIALSISFFTAFWLKGGQTLGMQAWRVRLVPSAGHRLSAGRCVLRCLAALLSLLPAGFGYWWCLFDRDGRYWHDHLSGTELVLLPPRDKRKRKNPG